MSGRPAHRIDQGLPPARRWTPRLGDLALDSATDSVGVVVDIPTDGGFAYHLRPPGGGGEWTAPADGSTLLPVEDSGEFESCRTGTTAGTSSLALRYGSEAP